MLFRVLMNNVNKVFHKILNKLSLFDLSIKDHSNNNVSVIQNHFWEVLSVSCNSRKELNMKIDKHFFMSFSFILIGLSISNSDIVELFELWEHVRDKPKHIAQRQVSDYGLFLHVHLKLFRNRRR